MRSCRSARQSVQRKVSGLCQENEASYRLNLKPNKHEIIRWLLVHRPNMTQPACCGVCVCVCCGSFSLLWLTGAVDWQTDRSHHLGLVPLGLNQNRPNSNQQTGETWQADVVYQRSAMKMGRRGRSSCQDVNRKNKSPFSRCVMAQNGFTAGDEFFNLHGGGVLKFPPLRYEDAALHYSGFNF